MAEQLIASEKAKCVRDGMLLNSYMSGMEKLIERYKGEPLTEARHQRLSGRFRELKRIIREIIYDAQA